MDVGQGEACTRRNLNVLVTTHNPATLDGLTREQWEGVVLCFWDREKKASRLVPLLELPRADVLLERGHLGDLVTRRVLEQHLMPGFEESQKLVCALSRRLRGGQPHRGRAGRRLADLLANTVRSCVETANPWIITPASEDILYDLSELLRLCDVYAREMAVQSIGLSDTAIIEEARRPKGKYNQPGDQVHIWTRDLGLKAHEPDAEPEPLLS